MQSTSDEEATPWVLRGPGFLVPIVMVVATLFSMAISIAWRPWHDTPLMMYCGFLMEQFDKVPYRDFFEMNPPGTHLLHQGVVKLFGTAEAGQRAWDLVWLAATQAAIVFYLRRFGLGVGLCAASLISLQYLSWGAMMSLERDYLCLLPLALSLGVSFRTPGWALWQRAFVIGLLAGACVAIKPPFLLYFPFFLMAAVYWEEHGDGAPSKPSWTNGLPAFLRVWIPSTAIGPLALTLAAGLAGLAVVPGLCALYLISHGAWSGFLEMALEYWPIYAELRPDASVRVSSWNLETLVRMAFNTQSYLFFGLVVFAALFAFPQLWRRSVRGRDRVELASLIALIVLGEIYLFTSGKFWFYHMLPLYFGMSLIAGFAGVDPLGRDSSAGLRWLRVAVVIGLFLYPLHLPDQADRILAGKPYTIYEDTTHVAELLEKMARPGDQVQPFDVTTGAIHAMLLAEVDLATPFIYDFHFYHHPQSEITQRLRARLLASMKKSEPRFVIYAAPSWSPNGPQTEPEYPAIRELIAANYRPVWSGERLALLERRRSQAK